MRSLRLFAAASLVLAAVAAAPPARALVPEDGARTLSPYFHVDSGASESFPLEETRTDAHVAGPIGQVTVRQVFRNRGTAPLEATYVFPASTRAAVHGLRMRIGERTVEARIARRGEARAAYVAARDGGQRAALLEEQRPNVFTMQVANVMPGERVEVALEYSELLVPEDGVYELVVPAVVGPRYGGGADPAADGWIAGPHLHQGAREPWRFSFAARVESAVPLRDLGSPSHALDVRFGSPRSAEVTLREPGGGTRDLVLRWRLAGDAIEAGALVVPDREGGEGGWFTAMVEPPARAPSAGLDREYVFLVDVSGSMNGFPLDTAKRLLADLLGRLGGRDLVNVVLFAGGSEVLAPQGSLAATSENVARALALVERQRGGGGTELMAGLRAAYAIPRAGRPVSRSVVVVTDGYVGVEAQAFRFVREHLAEANLFSFGIGSAVNRHLVEGLARAGAGEPFVVLDAGHAPAAAERFRAYVERPLLTDVEARFEGVDVRDVVPGRLPDLFARRPLVVSGRFRGPPRGRLVLTGTTGEGPWRAAVELSPPRVTAPSGGDAPVRLLWARAWVAQLEDDLALAPAPELEEAITDLGLAHRLVTPFTSFVAVDSQVAHRAGRPEAVVQPLPLPAGVSDHAIGEARRFARLQSASPPASPTSGAGREPRPAKASAPEAPRAADAVGAAAPAERTEHAAPKPARALRATCLDAPAGTGAAIAREVEARLAPLAARLALPSRMRISFDASGRAVSATLPPSAPSDLVTAVRRALLGLPCRQAHGHPFELTVMVDVRRR